MPTDYCKGSIIVTIGDKNLMNLCVDDIDTKNVRELAASIKGKIGKIKNLQDKKERRQMKVFDMMPTFLVEVLLKFIAFMSYNLQTTFKPLKVKKTFFGFGIVTNVTPF